MEGRTLKIQEERSFACTQFFVSVKILTLRAINPAHSHFRLVQHTMTISFFLKMYILEASEPENNNKQKRKGKVWYSVDGKPRAYRKVLRGTKDGYRQCWANDGWKGELKVTKSNVLSRQSIQSTEQMWLKLG